MNRGDKIFKGVMLLMACTVILIISLMIIEMFQGASVSIKKFGFGFLVSSEWDPVQDRYGALPFIFGTVVSALLAILIALPLSLGAAIFLAEYSPGWLRQPVAFLIELLAAIPSVVYGLWGIFVLVPLCRVSIQPFLQKYLGFIPLFQGPMYGIGMFSASLVLAVMVIPFICSVSREVMMTVPVAQKEAACALGATKWETIRMAVLPYCQSGILGSVILGLGRAVGETMAVTMLIGNTPQIKASLFESAHTMSSVLANEFTEAVGNVYLSALIEIGLILFAVALIINVCARFLIWAVARGPRVNPAAA